MNINNLPEPYRTLAFIRREQRDTKSYHNHSDILEGAFDWQKTVELHDFWDNVCVGKLPPLTEQSIKDIVLHTHKNYKLDEKIELQAININRDAVHPTIIPLTGEWTDISIDMDKIFLNTTWFNTIGGQYVPTPENGDTSPNKGDVVYSNKEYNPNRKQTGRLVVSSKSTMEIKVTGCDDCPFKQVDDYGCQSCSHPNNMYDGNKDEWFEYCPLKQADTVVKFEKPQK